MPLSSISPLSPSATPSPSPLPSRRSAPPLPTTPAVAAQADAAPLRIALPKGRMWSALEDLLTAAGLGVAFAARAYRPTWLEQQSVGPVEVKVLKPQSIVEMLAAGTRDVGFTGADWVAELDADLVEVLDLGLSPVRLVAAAPRALANDERWTRPGIRVASEYQRITQRWLKTRGLDATVLRSWGATEVLPPEDADVIVDNSATGSTLEANQLVVVDELLCSTTRLYASRAAWDDPLKRQAIDHLSLLLRSVLEARQRLLLEVNVHSAQLAAALEVLPCMREPTVAALAHGDGFAVKAAVPRRDVPSVIAALRAVGGTDIVVSTPSQIVP